MGVINKNSWRNQQKITNRERKINNRNGKKRSCLIIISITSVNQGLKMVHDVASNFGTLSIRPQLFRPYYRLALSGKAVSAMFFFYCWKIVYILIRNLRIPNYSEADKKGPAPTLSCWKNGWLYRESLNYDWKWPPLRQLVSPYLWNFLEPTLLLLKYKKVIQRKITLEFIDCRKAKRQQWFRFFRKFQSQSILVCL